MPVCKYKSTAKADCLSRLKRLKEALAFYSTCLIAATNNNDFTFNSERLGPLVDSISSNNNSEKSPTTKDALSCQSCSGVLRDPVCLPCGHTHCRSCSSNMTNCSRCNSANPAGGARNLHVLASKLCLKYWPRELRAAELKNKGNRLCAEEKPEEAVKMFKLASELDPTDHYLLGNLSHAWLKSGRPRESLSAALAAVALNPMWAKGHFRAAAALRALDRPEEAFAQLHMCLMLEEEGSAAAVRAEITDTLHRVMSKWAEEEEGTSVPDVTMLFMEEKDLSDSSVSSRLASRVDRLLQESFLSAERLMSSSTTTKNTTRQVDVRLVDKDDYECPLCLRLLFRPVTTPCGHTFCKTCLDRTLDHAAECPMCKGDLTRYLAERREAVDQFVTEAMTTLLSEEIGERKRLHDAEMEELAKFEKEIPVFVCTMSFPSIPCPLHVFEPRYRLMMRRCMEAGTREFGMCCSVDGTHMPFADYGTMLEIRDIQYFPDGRAVVDTVGSRRFRVLSRGMRDGYNTASVEFIKDDKLDCDSINELKSLHDTTLSQSRTWFSSMSQAVREGILSHYGSIPEVEDNYWTLSNGPAWAWWIIAIMPLDPRGQLQILSQTTLKRRLEGIQRIIRAISRDPGLQQPQQ